MMIQRKASPGRRRNLLIEIGTEELPPGALKFLARSFAESLFQGLVEAGVAQDGSGRHEAYATPRRLAVWVRGVLPRQPGRVVEKRGPALGIAFRSDGTPTEAAEGFARSCGVSVHRLKRVQTERGAWLAHSRSIAGLRLNRIVSDCLDASIRNLPVPKRMRWGEHDHEFVRPVHWILALHGSEVIRIHAFGFKAGRITRGHRFHAPGQIRIASADRYLDTLKSSGFVIADYRARQSIINRQIRRLAAKSGVEAIVDPNMLDEVTGLVEWPVALMGSFDRRYLKLPREVLIATMELHQKYFCTADGRGKLTPGFLVVSNLKSRSPKRVREGNERVLRARLSDAEFFWQADQKRSLESRVDDLAGVMFHKRLGSVLDRSRRIRVLAVRISTILGLETENTALAARLCKADLVTDMVGEFPKLQGVVGRYYALNEGMEKTVSGAIEGHYLPRHAGDRLPSGGVAQSLALADRIDTLCGIFSCGELPTGDRDPFGLRRAALGILRILIEGGLNLDLDLLIDQGMDNYRQSGLEGIDTGGGTTAQVKHFILERMKGYAQDRGIGIDVLLAAQESGDTHPCDLFARSLVVQRFLEERTDTAEALVSANKRIANILSGVTIRTTAFDTEMMSPGPESRLARKMLDVERRIADKFASGEYWKALELMSGLKKPVDLYFDSVMIMVDDPKIRDNRIALLAHLRSLFLSVADLSRVRARP